MRSSRHRALLLGAVLAALVPGTARAFCRSTTSPVPPDHTPTSKSCGNEDGLPLFWRNECLGYSLHEGGSRDVSYEDAERVLSATFSAWTSVRCGNAVPSLETFNLGRVRCDATGWGEGSGDRARSEKSRVITFRDDGWRYAHETVALTSVTYDPATGEILDADMEINTTDFTLSAEESVPAKGYDLATVLQHETGHFLGFAHSPDEDSVMTSRYSPGTKKRALGADDNAAMCEVYRAGGQRPVLSGRVTSATRCRPTPTAGFSRTCDDGPLASACRMSLPRRASREEPLAFGLLAVLAATVALRWWRRTRA